MCVCVCVYVSPGCSLWCVRPAREQDNMLADKKAQSDSVKTKWSNIKNTLNGFTVNNQKSELCVFSSSLITLHHCGLMVQRSVFPLLPWQYFMCCPIILASELANNLVILLAYVNNKFNVVINCNFLMNSR